MRRAIVFLLGVYFALAMAGGAMADFVKSESWFKALAEDYRTQVQTDLALTGFYTALADGEFGPATYRALTKYQLISGEIASGVLSGASRQLLSDRAAAIYVELGIDYVADDKGQSAVLLPKALLTETADTLRGRAYGTPDGRIVFNTIRKPFTEQSFEDLYATLADQSATRQIAYLAFHEGRFVVSGTADGRDFYLMFYNVGDESVGFTLSWAKDAAAQGNMLAVYIASHFIPLRFLPDEDTPPPAEGPPATIEADTPAAAPEPTYRAFGSFLLVDGAPDVIALDGEITTNSPLDFRRALKARPDAKTLVLKSNGGVVSSGLLIAHEVKERGMNTVIRPSMGCYSACAFIFFAGNDRHAGGELGVHQIWSETPDLSSAQTTLSDILEAMDEFGVPHEVVSIMLRTPASEMHVFTPDEIASFEIDKRNPGSSTSETSPAEVVDLTLPPLADAETAPDEVGKVTSQPLEALLLEASDDGKSGATPFSGTVVWSQGSDPFGRPSILGTVRIPSRDLSATILMRRNSDASLPADHLMEIDFQLSAAFAGGSIAGLPGVLLKNERLVQGTPLIGASARVKGNFFLFALSSEKGDADSNGNLLRTGKWIDLAIVYATGKRAIVTLEKNAIAERIFLSVFESQPENAVPRAVPATVQFGAYGSQSNALRVIQALEQSWSAELGHGKLEVRRVENGAASRFRVVLPVYSRPEAVKICEGVRAGGGDCYVPVETP